MSGDGFDDRGGRGSGGHRRPHRASRPLWPIGLPDPPASDVEAGQGDVDRRAEREALASLLVDSGKTHPDPDLGEIVVILLVSTLAGLRDRLERDGFHAAAGLVHDLAEIADDFVTRFST